MMHAYKTLMNRGSITGILEGRGVEDQRHGCLQWRHANEHKEMGLV